MSSGWYTAGGVEAWMAGLVARLREAGVRDIAVRLDKGFFSKSIARRMEPLGVSHLLKVPRYGGLDGFRGAWETASANKAGDRELRTASGEMWGRRLLSVERRKQIGPDEGELDLAAWETAMSADVLTNIESIGPVDAWRTYNAGAVVEQRIEELGQLSAGRTAVDDLAGNALPWGLAALAYQLLHIPRPPNLAPDHRGRRFAARARLTDPDPGLAKAPRDGTPSPCLREPPGVRPRAPPAPRQGPVRPRKRPPPAPSRRNPRS